MYLVLGSFWRTILNISMNSSNTCQMSKSYVLNRNIDIHEKSMWIPVAIYTVLSQEWKIQNLLISLPFCHKK